MKTLYFWSQSLDNQSPDLILEDEKEISDDLERQSVIAEIYKVPGQKTSLSTGTPEITVRFSDPKFVIETLPIEKDQEKRLAPVIIYGELPDEFTAEWIANSRAKISRVIAQKLHRTLSKDTVEAINNWLTERLKEKKKKIEDQTKIISLVISFLAPLLVGGILQLKGIQPNLIQSVGLIALNNILVMSLPHFPINRPHRKNRMK